MTRDPELARPPARPSRMRLIVAAPVLALLWTALAWAGPVAGAAAVDGPCGPNPCAPASDQGPCGANPCGTVPAGQTPCGNNPCGTVPPSEGPCGANPCAPASNKSPCGDSPCPAPPAGATPNSGGTPAAAPGTTAPPAQGAPTTAAAQNPADNASTTVTTGAEGFQPGQAAPPFKLTKKSGSGTPIWVVPVAAVVLLGAVLVVLRARRRGSNTPA